MGIKFTGGTEYVEFFKNLVEKINQGGIPTLEDQFTYFTQTKCNLALYSAKRIFNQLFHEQISLPSRDTTIL